jgi:hypothetical protein
VLGLSAFLVLFFGAHLGLALSFVLVAFGAGLHHHVHGGDDPMSFRSILYWAITLMMACLMAGWLSAVVWRVPWFIDKWLDDHNFKWGYVQLPHIHLPLPHIMVVRTGGETVRGHVIFMGDKTILFYQYDHQMTRMLKRDDVESMFQCDQQERGDNIPQQTDCKALPVPVAVLPTRWRYASTLKGLLAEIDAGSFNTRQLPNF